MPTNHKRYNELSLAEKIVVFNFMKDELKQPEKLEHRGESLFITIFGDQKFIEITYYASQNALLKFKSIRDNDAECFYTYIEQNSETKSLMIELDKRLKEKRDSIVERDKNTQSINAIQPTIVRSSAPYLYHWFNAPLLQEKCFDEPKVEPRSRSGIEPKR